MWDEDTMEPEDTMGVKFDKDGWVKWNCNSTGNNHPAGTTVVEVRLGSGEVMKREASMFTWGETYVPNNNIVAYRLVKENPQPVVSDGGSSSYYTFMLHEGECETEDVIAAMVGNDFDLGNIIKCCRRIQALREGKGKAGNTEAYDLRKIKYTVEKLLNR